MSAYFFDSNAIVRRYVNEQGSSWVTATVDRTSSARIYVAAITGVEMVAAFARKLKASTLVRWMPPPQFHAFITISLRSKCHHTKLFLSNGAIASR